MNLVDQAQAITNYIEALEYENKRLRNALFRILEKDEIVVAKIEYHPENWLEFRYDTNGENLVIRKLDYSELGLISSQDRINHLKSKI